MSRLDDLVRELSGKAPQKGPLREGAFDGSRLHQRRIAAILGIVLGVSFTVCFLTGMLSHLIQYPPSWFAWPAQPAGLYRFTQGLHVATGIASIPLLLAKLWTVYPRLFRFPPLTSVAHLIERVALSPLVAGALFLLFSGIASITRWNPWPFSFPVAHYVAAWITIGGLIIHLGAKASVLRPALARAGTDHSDPAATPSDGLSRRGLLAVVFGAAGVLTLVTIGQTVRPLEWLGLLAPRKPTVGPQGFPVNKTAQSAGITAAATSPDYRLQVTGNIATPRTFTLDDLRAMPQREVTLPIVCVDGWSANVHWRGISLRDLLGSAGATEGATVEVRSLQVAGCRYCTSELNASHAWDEETVLALEANGDVLDLDHGFPVRLIGPNRPGVMQTKWVTEVVVR